MMQTHAFDWAAFENLDHLRRLQGASFDALGFGPVESHGESVFNEPGVSLKRYRARPNARPPLLLVPAPIKRAYIFDLSPEVNVVQRCVAGGERVFLLEWQPAGPDFGLAEFGDRLILACLEAAGGEPPILVAHSLGGLLAAIFAALHPERIRGLVLIATPLHFGPDAGIFGRTVADVDLARLPESVPGSFISTMSFRASPEAFGWERWLDLVQSFPDSGMLRNYLRVERWTLDEFPMPRRLFADIVHLLVHEDRFVRGSLAIGGKAAAPSRITVPLLCVVDPDCSIVPRPAVQPFLDAAGSEDKSVLEYQREAGVCLQHVGPLVGKRAHARLWPEILRWIETR
ncbi:MAG: alpha/beta fold hydrolase [Betaproteobacteria bacterium]|nr:alpha/beta fold hydrolase [Betaproteobacteria bacterium]